MKRLWSYVWKNIGFYITGLLTMLVSIGLDMCDPYLKKILVDDVIMDGNMSVFKGTLMGLAGITLSRAVLGYAKEMAFDVGSSRVIMNLRKDLFTHIQKQSFSFFDGVNTGELMSRVKDDADNVWHATGFGIMLCIEQGVYFIVASVMLFTLSWKLALVCLITMPLIAWMAVQLEKRIGQTFEKISDQRAVMNTTAQENIAGVRLVKAFGREKYEIQKFLNQNKQYYDLNVEQARVWAKYQPKIEFLSNIVLVLVTTVGGALVIGEEMSVGMLVAFSTYIYMLIWPMRMLGWLTNILAQCKAALKKMDKLFEEVPTVTNPEYPIVLEDAKGAVEFRNVGLEYNGVPVLKNININIKPGSTVAIMGLTGSGKSSVINLLGRFYDCTAGHVLFDGVDVRELDIKSLRKQISVVMQDTFLFSDTIEENIKFGSEDIAGEELLAAAKDAQASEFILKMPEGYKSVIGERGIGLSGGQKQRVSIARALARDCRVLILDDATSALDMETEYEIQKALEKRGDVTKIIIAHRISAVKNANEILIIEDGEIVERGTHLELLEQKGKYFETYSEQFKGIGFMNDVEEQEEVV